MKRFILLIVIATLAGCFGAEPQKTGKEGKPMPQFNMLLMDSTTWLNTASIPSGKPTVLFYFSPHCAYCRAQTKKIIEDMDMLKDLQFYFISNFSLTEVKEFYKEYQLAKYSNITTGIDTANALGDYFEISAVPYIAIYGKNKTLNKTFMGKIYSSQFKKAAAE